MHYIPKDFLYRPLSNNRYTAAACVSSQPISLRITIYCEWFSMIACIIDSWREFVGIILSKVSQRIWVVI